jgi:hypothetical protein
MCSFQAELEERYTTQLKIFQAREKSLQEQLQQSMHGTQVSLLVKTISVYTNLFKSDCIRSYKLIKILLNLFLEPIRTKQLV